MARKPTTPEAKPARARKTPVKAGEVAKVVAPKKGSRANKVAAIADKPLPKQRPSTKAKAVAPKIQPASEQVIAEALEEFTPKELEFFEAYLSCMNGTRAWHATYGAGNDNSAASQASDKLRQPKVRAYIAKRMKAAFERTEEAADKLIQTYQHAAYGDINELVEYRRDSCRYCHGKEHRYQYTPAELERSKAEFEADGKDPDEFDEKGGVGFNPKKEPHPDCPECHGEGKGRILFKDTRNLSPAGLALYAGAKIGKEGIEIKTVSQERAREMLARIQKLFEDKTEVTVNLDTDTLEEKFAAKMRAAHERMAAVLAERGITPDD